MADAVKHPKMYRIFPHKKQLNGPNVDIAEIEKPALLNDAFY